MEKYEIIKFENNSVVLDFNVSPLGDTVWLSLDQMSKLFDRDKSVISRHIKNIFKEGELDEKQVVAKNAITAIDGKTYLVAFYNLDVIISIGYRVKSKNGVIFRKWATSVLKELLLKGYLIDKERSLVTNENFVRLSIEVDELKNDVEALKKAVAFLNPNETVIYENQAYSSFAFINKILKKAIKTIVIIDGYLDDSILEFFVNVNKDVNITLVTHKENRISSSVRDKFMKEFPLTHFVQNRFFHDRFIIIDDKAFSIGCSLNSLGNKISIVTKLDNAIARDILRIIIGENDG